MTIAEQCPSCLQKIQPVNTATEHDRFRIICGTCGTFECTGSAFAMASKADIDAYARASLMHRVYSASLSKGFIMTSTVVRDWLKSPSLPSPTEQLENLILWMAKSSRAAGQTFDITYDSFQAIIGAADADGFSWVLQHTYEAGLIDHEPHRPLSSPARVINTALTLRGWQVANDISKTGKGSKLAFIAMQFGDPQLQSFVGNHLSASVASTGFILRALNEEQPAGLIDDQLRVAIRRARFVLVDLTHGNRGAYWEAGFAEGLGKPVIYLCRADVFNDSTNPNRPHFDTNHLVTIIWDPSNMADAAKRLAACIRATLPDEAMMGADDGVA